MALAFNYNKGDRLKVKLANEIFEGDYLGGNSGRIDLSNVIEYPTNVEVAKEMSFYRLEIVSVSILNKHKTTTTQNEDEAVANSDKAIQLSGDEFNRLKEMTLDYIYMPTMDNRYVEATNHLLRCESVGVVGLGGEFGQMKTISLLVLSSWDQVYIFDLYLYRDFPSELRQILECNLIKKIVHDSRALVKCLYHCHKVQIKNIFDTLVADKMISKSRNETLPDHSRSISDCLEYYLNIPNNLLLTTEDVKSKKWDQRPLTDTCKAKAAQLSTYLYTLKVKFENIMLKNFTEAVKLHSTSVRDMNGCMARLTLSKNEIPAEVKKAADKDFFR